MFRWKKVRDKTVGGPFPKNLFIRKSNKNNIFGGRSRNGSLGIFCMFFALRMQSVQLYPRSGYEKPLGKARSVFDMLDTSYQVSNHA